MDEKYFHTFDRGFLSKYKEKQPNWGFNGLGYVVYKRTYSRDNFRGHKEEWWETVKRCVEGAQKIGASYTEKEAEKLYDYIFNLKGSFSGRGLWQLGTELVDKIGGPSLLNCWFTDINSIEDFIFIMTHLSLGGGVGYSVQRSFIHELPKVKSGVEIKHLKTNDADFIVPDSRQGWAALLRKVLQSLLYTGESFTYSTILIRGYGAPLKTFGGTASGPEILVEGITEICKVVNERVNKKLRSIDVLDIANIIGKIIVAGSARRSAQIAIGDPDDMLFLKAKDWSKGQTPAWRANSNNSIYADKFEEIVETFWKGYEGNGEPYGLVNLPLSRKFGRLNEKADDSKVNGFNPCQPGWATVLTPDGIRTFDDIKIGSIIWSGKQWTKISNKVKTGVKSVYEYHTRAGIFIGTENHRVVSSGEKIEVGNAESIDLSTRKITGNFILNPQDIMDGLIIGDGSVHKASNNLVYLCIGKKDHDYFNSEISHLILSQSGIDSEHAYRIETTINYLECPKTYERTIPNRFRFGTQQKVIGFLKGLFSANGCVIGKRVALKASSFDIISQTQEMLSSIGIRSYYTTNKENDVQFSNGTYTCKQSYDLNIGTDKRIFKELIGFLQNYKNEKLEEICKAKEYPDRAKTTYEIVEKKSLGDHVVYDITVEADEHTYWTSGLLVSNCAEITLEDKECCNLSEIFLPNISSKEELIDLAKLLYKTQKAITDLEFPYKETVEVIKKNRRLGLGITGWLQSTPEQVSWLNDCYNELKEFDKQWSDLNHWNTSIKLTCVKPSGTLSLLAGVTPGVHPAYARYYIRRVRMGSNDPLVDYCRKLGYQVQFDVGIDGREDYTRYVVSFPCQAPEHAVLSKDLSAIEQLEWVVKAQTIWSDNAVSVTVYYKKEELPAIKDWLKENYENKIKSVSFLLHSEHGFNLAPYEEITKDQYEKLITKIKPIVSFTDSWDGSIESVECAGGACPIK
jgi:ribonucleotide reductase alpha subunit